MEVFVDLTILTTLAVLITLIASTISITSDTVI